MKIAVGADPFGFDLKAAVKDYLMELGHECIDLGGSPDNERPYYEVAHELAHRVGAGEVERGILVCGTGMGMAIIANKHAGVYAAVCDDPAAAAKARSINNANVLTLGGMVTAPFKAREIVDAFLSTEFKTGWGDDLQTFLDRSMTDIRAIENRQFRNRKK